MMLERVPSPAEGTWRNSGQRYGVVFTVTIAFYVVGAVASLTAWVVGRWYFTRPAGQENASCGYCGYSVEGLPSRTCPECGRDLDVVGIRRRSPWWVFSAGTRLLLSLLSFTLAYALAAILIWIPFDTHLRPGRFWVADAVSFDAPRHTAGWQILRIKTTTCWPWERSTAFPTMTSPHIWSIETFRDPGVVGLRGAWEIMHGSFPGPFPRRQFTIYGAGYHRWIDPATGAARIESGDWRANLDAWLSNWSLTMKEPQLPAQVLPILPVALATPLAVRGPRSFPGGQLATGTGSYSSWEPNAAWAESFWAGAVLLYLFGLVWITKVSTYRRAMAGAK